MRRGGGVARNSLSLSELERFIRVKKKMAYFCEGYARPTTLPYLTSYGSLNRVYTHLTNLF